MPLHVAGFASGPELPLLLTTARGRVGYSLKCPTQPLCVSGPFGIATARAAVISLLSPAREAGGAEDWLGNSGNHDRFGGLP